MIYQKDVDELFHRFIDQFLVINLLSKKKGFLLHASGVVWKGKGVCFAGPSGAGKSTLLDLFKGEVARESLLNDDRLAVRKHGKIWRLYGTPWYGESRVSSSGSAPLSAVFLIRHSPRNYARRLSTAQVLPRLMVLGLVPVWDGAASAAVLATFQELIEEVPFFELGFVPDERVIDLITGEL